MASSSAFQILVSMALVSSAFCDVQKPGFVQSLSPISRNRIGRTILTFKKIQVHQGSLAERPAYLQRQRCLLSMSSAPSLNQNGAWLPIGSVKSLVGDIPVSVEVIGEKLVVWRNGTTWSVMRDVCPHRLAPLSQGRVDRTTGCLECPYHGWQFSANGACMKIPQLNSERQLSPQSGGADRGRATAFPVRLTGDLIWSFLPLPPGQVPNY